MAIVSWNNLATPDQSAIAQSLTSVYGLTPIAPIEGDYADIISPVLSDRVRWRATGPNQCAAFTVSLSAVAAAVPWRLVGLLDVVQPFGRPLASQGYNARVLNFASQGTFDSTYNPTWGTILPPDSSSPQGLQSFRHNLWFLDPKGVQFASSILVVLPLGRTLGSAFTAGDISIGGLWLGQGFEFDGVDSSWQVGVDDASRWAESEGRQVYSSNGTIVDTMQCSISVQEQEKALFSVAEPFNFRRWIRETGISRPTCILPRTQTELEMVELGIHGRIQGRAPRITHQGEGWHRIEPFTIRALR